MNLREEYPYLYETHMHTAESSACGKALGSEMARAAKAFGYTGVFITDHHWGGNTRPSRDLPWEEWVDKFCSGYEAVKAAGDEVGLQVFMGWESGYHATEFLIYGPDKAWMKAHPELCTISVEEQYRLIHEAGGMVIHAHPFREAAYIKEVRLYPECVDGVEGVNAHHSSILTSQHYNPKYNERAIAYAKEHGLPITAGSDMHTTGLVGAGVAFATKLNSVQDYVERIKSGKDYVVTDGVRWYDPQGNLLCTEE